MLLHRKVYEGFRLEELTGMLLEVLMISVDLVAPLLNNALYPFL